MNLKDFLTSLVSWYSVLPAAVLCFAPMKDCLKKDMKTTVRTMLFIAVPVIFLASILEAIFPLGYFTLIPIVLAVALLTYHNSLKVSFPKSAAFFSLICALMSFMANFANGFDAYLHPTSNINEFSLEAGIFQAVISTVFAIAIYHPLEKYGSEVVAQPGLDRAWTFTIPASMCFLIYNISISPKKYETMHVNLVFAFYWGSLVLLLVLLLFLCVSFYFIISGTAEAQKIQERNRILEMQESLYIAQQRFMDESAKVRHDFKHTIRMLGQLVDEGDLKSIKEYMDEYIASQPQNDTIHFCENMAVNALLNYGMHIAESRNIERDWEVELPRHLSVSDTDLCSIIGNIMENAVIANESVPEEDRFIDLSIHPDADGNLYIIASNAFDGNVVMDGDEYRSTHKNGSGIGLNSIRSTASKYEGRARFRHQGNEFYSDVIIPLSK